MGRRVYLHIGTMKSATSHIQQLCELNSGHLDACGILWIAGDLRYKGIRDLLGRPIKETDAPGTWSALARQARQYPGDLLLSNELLAALNSNQVRRIVKAFSRAEVHVIVTARDLARVIPSHWQTTLRNGGTQGWSEFAAAVCTDVPEGLASHTHEWFWCRHDVPSIIARWREYVPAEQITLVTVPPNGMDREAIARRFGSVIGVSLAGLVQPEGSINPSLGAYSAELLRRLSQQTSGFAPSERTSGLKSGFGASLVEASDDLEPGFGLTEAQHRWVSERARAMIEEIRRDETLVVGDLTDLVPQPGPATGAVDPAETSDADLLRVACNSLVGMVGGFTELTLERDALSCRLLAMQRDRDRLQDRVERQQKRIATLVSQRDALRQAQPSPGRLRVLLQRSRTMRRLAHRLRRASGTSPT